MRNQSSATQVTRNPTLLIALTEAKRQVRIYHDDLDDQVQVALSAATAFCELRTNRILRKPSTIVQRHDGWASRYRIDVEPAVAITSLGYYDADGELQTVPEANYRLTLASSAGSILEVDSQWSRPTLDDQANPVVITYTAGYDMLPDEAKQAILLMTQVFFGDLDDRQVEANRRAAGDLLAVVDWGAYR